MTRLRQQHVIQPVTPVTDNSQTLVKNMLYTHKNDLSPISHDIYTSHIWCQSPTIFQIPTSASKTDLLHLYHAHASMPTSTEAITYTVFSQVEQLQGSCHSFTVSKCWFKFGNLQFFCYYSNENPLTVLRETIPYRIEYDFISSISAMKLCISGSREKYVSNLLNTCKILLYHWIWHIWYTFYPADTINIIHTSFSTLRLKYLNIYMYGFYKYTLLFDQNLGFCNTPLWQCLRDCQGHTFCFDDLFSLASGVVVS